MMANISRKFKPGKVSSLPHPTNLWITK